MVDLTATSYIDIMGFDFLVQCEIEIYSEGCEAQLYGPPEDCYEAEDPGFYITSITLELDAGGGVLGPAFEATGGLFDVLEEDPKIYDDCLQAVYEHISEDRYYRRGRNRRY